jgi:hypothetical protein
VRVRIFFIFSAVGNDMPDYLGWSWSAEKPTGTVCLFKNWLNCIFGRKLDF